MINKSIKKLLVQAREPVYDLSAHLSHVDETDPAWEEVKFLALSGSDEEKFICLTVLANERPENLKENIPLIIDEISKAPVVSEKLAIPILTLIRNLNLSEYDKFCLQMLNYAKDKGRTQLESMSFRSLISLDWTKARTDLEKTISGGPQPKVIDTLAYFRFKNGDAEFDGFVSSLPISLSQRVLELQPATTQRLKEHYKKA